MKRVVMLVLLVMATGCMKKVVPDQKPVTPQGPRIDVTTDDDPSVAGSAIWVDNEPKGRAPLVVTTTTGRHLVEVKKPGRITFAQWVTVKHAQETIVVAPRLVAMVRVIPNHWTYDTTSSEAPPATQIVWEGGTEDFDGAQVFFIERVSIAANGASRVDERDYYRKAADGLHRLGVRGDIESSTATSGTHTISDTTFATPQRILPVPFQLGTTWSAGTNQTLVTKTTVTGNQARTSSGKSTSTITGDFAVSGREKVTVPAGVFDCLVVRGKTVNRTMEREGALAGNVTTVTTTIVEWYAPRIGLVQSESTSDAETQVRGKVIKERRTASMRLKKYRVERSGFEMEAIGFVQDLRTEPVEVPPSTEVAPTEPLPPPQQ